MKISELLTELTFQGHTCTKDCGGHKAGYAYALAKGLKAQTNTPSKSFDSGTGIAVKQSKTAAPKPTTTSIAATSSTKVPSRSF